MVRGRDSGWRVDGGRRGWVGWMWRGFEVMGEDAGLSWGAGGGKGVVEKVEGDQGGEDGENEEDVEDG
ncbi:hypothetical protein, partial [Prescottella equi]|uniref:hypothetical protein n=1 Tax=Rhodococcus hoagii TaxID=43767 RepID=UPI001C92D814